MSLYQLDLDGEPHFVEAASIEEALAAWRAWAVALGEERSAVESEQVTVISDHPVIRSGGAVGSPRSKES